MRSTLRKVLLVGVAASALVTGVAPAASAAGGDAIQGGCFFATNQLAAVTGGANVGVIGDASLTFEASGLPADATVSCQIQVNGVPAPRTTFSYSGIGVQAGADRISYTAADSDLVLLCQRVVYGDGTDTGWTCQMPCTCEFPPQPIIDALNLVIGVVDNAFAEFVDPQLCPVLVANAGTYGPMTIRPDGDVYVFDPLALGLSPLYDCSPYGNF